MVKIFDGVRNIHMYGVICDPMHYDRENKKLHAWNFPRASPLADIAIHGRFGADVARRV